MDSYRDDLSTQYEITTASFETVCAVLKMHSYIQSLLICKQIPIVTNLNYFSV